MTEKKTWQPHIEHLPLFNPFEPSTQWTKQMGAGDEIRIDDEDEDSPAEEIEPTDPATDVK